MNRDHVHQDDAAAERSSLPPDLEAVDRLLHRALARPAAGDHAQADADRVARIHRASRHLLLEALEREVIAVFPASRPVGRPLSRARFALAAAAVLALAVGSIETMRLILGGNATETKIVQDAPALDRSMPSDPATPGATEATLVALLVLGSHDPGHEFPEWSGWIDERAFVGTDAGRAVVPVLQTRGAGIDDFAAELGSILGMNSSRPL